MMRNYFVLNNYKSYKIYVSTNLIFSLFHEKFRTNLILEPTLEGKNLAFRFRGFKGTYDLSVELEDGKIILVDDQFVLLD